MKAFAVPLLVLFMAMAAPSADANPLLATGSDDAVCHNSIDAGGEKNYRLVNGQPVELPCKDSAGLSTGALPNPFLVAGSLFVLAFVGILLLI